MWGSAPYGKYYLIMGVFDKFEELYDLKTSWIRNSRYNVETLHHKKKTFKLTLWGQPLEQSDRVVVSNFSVMKKSIHF